ncbi:MAG: hypothetical protein V1773_10310 [bacterium]
MKKSFLYKFLDLVLILLLVLSQYNFLFFIKKVNIKSFDEIKLSSNLIINDYCLFTYNSDQKTKEDSVNLKSTIWSTLSNQKFDFYKNHSIYIKTNYNEYFAENANKKLSLRAPPNITLS